MKNMMTVGMMTILATLAAFAGTASNSQTTNGGDWWLGSTTSSWGQSTRDAYSTKVSESQNSTIRVFGYSFQGHNYSGSTKTDNGARKAEVKASLTLGGWYNPLNGTWSFSAAQTFTGTYGYNYDIATYGVTVWVGPVPVYVWAKAKASLGYTASLTIYYNGTNSSSEFGVKGTHSVGGAISGEVGGGVGIPVAYFGIAAEVKFIEGYLKLTADASNLKGYIDLRFELNVIKIKIFLVAEVNLGWWKIRYEYKLAEWTAWAYVYPILNVTVY